MFVHTAKSSFSCFQSIKRKAALPGVVSNTFNSSIWEWVGRGRQISLDLRIAYIVSSRPAKDTWWDLFTMQTNLSPTKQNSSPNFASKNVLWGWRDGSESSFPSGPGDQTPSFSLQVHPLQYLTVSFLPLLPAPLSLSRTYTPELVADFDYKR